MTANCTIGDRVRAARERQGWSREALAFRSGVSWPAIAQVETGRRKNLRPGTLSALADALRVSIDYLVTGRVASTPMLEHRALCYGSDDECVATIVPFLERATERGEPALVVTTNKNIELLRQHLGAHASGVEFVERSTFCRAPQLTLDGYRSFLNKAVDEGGSWARIVGEIAWAGLPESRVRAWERYEALLNLALASAPATMVCLYDTRVLSPKIVEVARATHPELMDANGVTGNSRCAVPSDFLLDSWDSRGVKARNSRRARAEQ